MGFYVSGVDAPKNCRECGRDLAAIANCVYTKRLVLPEEHDMSSGRHPLCPIFPVETPHGRTIDADALAKRIKDEGRNQAEYYADRYAPVVMAYGDCYGKVQSAPTIIPAEEGEEQREYEAQVEAAQYCEMYEPSYDSETGAL